MACRRGRGCSGSSGRTCYGFGYCGLGGTVEFYLISLAIDGHVGLVAFEFFYGHVVLVAVNLVFIFFHNICEASPTPPKEGLSDIAEARGLKISFYIYFFISGL